MPHPSQRQSLKQKQRNYSVDLARTRRQLDNLMDIIKNDKNQAISIMQEKGSVFLKFAICYGDETQVKAILDFWSENQECFPLSLLNPNHEGITNLHDALSPHRYDAKMASHLLEKIIEHNEAVNPADQEGKTPLHLAAVNGDIETVRVITTELQRRNQCVNNLTTEKLCSVTPYYLSLQEGHLAIMDILVDQTSQENLSSEIRAIYNAMNSGHHVAVQKALAAWKRKGKEINPAETDSAVRDTVLHLAVRLCSLETVRYLLEELDSEEAFNPMNAKGETPFHYACALKGPEARTCASLFLEKFHKNKINPFLKLDQNLIFTSLGNDNHFIVDMMMPTLIEQQIDFLKVFKLELYELALQTKYLPLIPHFLPALLVLGKENIKQNIENVEFWQSLLQGSFLISDQTTLFEIWIFLLENELIKNEINFQSYFCYTLEMMLKENNPQLTIAFIETLRKHTSLDIALRATERAIQKMALKKAPNYLTKIVQSLTKEKEARCALKAKRISTFQKQLKKEDYITQSMPGNEKNLLDLQAAYSEFKAIIQKIIVDFDNIETEAEIIQHAERHQAFLALSKQKYLNAKKIFESAEVRLRNEIKAQLAQDLSPRMEKLESVRAFVVAELTALLDSGHVTGRSKIALERSAQALNQAITQCEEAIKNADSALSPKLEEAFTQLEACRICAQGDLITLSAKPLQKQKNEELLLAKDAEIKVLQGALILKINEIQGLLAFGQEAGHVSLETDLSELRQILQSKQQLLAQAIPEKLEDKNNLICQLYRDSDNGSLKLTSLRLKSQIQQIEEANAHALLEQLTAVRQKISDKIHETRKHLNSALQDPYYSTIIENVSDPLYPDCHKVSLALEKLSAFAESATQGKVIVLERLERRLGDFSRWAEDKIELVKKLKADFATFSENKVNQPSFLPLFSADREPSSPALEFAQSPEKSRKNSFPPTFPPKRRQKNSDVTAEQLPLTLPCAKEREHLNKAISVAQENTTFTSTSEKVNLLLLSIAMLFEGMKRTYKNSAKAEREESFYPGNEIEIRNAIFHRLLGDNYTQEKYEQLLGFSIKLYDAALAREDWDQTITLFFEILPKVSPDKAVIIATIETHIQQLRDYEALIKQGTIEIEQDLSRQSNIALWVGQLSALLEDLKKYSVEGDELSFFIKAKHTAICEILQVSERKFYLISHAIRHEGPEAIWAATERLCCALAKKSSRQPAQSAAAAVDETQPGRNLRQSRKKRFYSTSPGNSSPGNSSPANNSPLRYSPAWPSPTLQLSSPNSPMGNSAATLRSLGNNFPVPAFYLPGGYFPTGQSPSSAPVRYSIIGPNIETDMQNLSITSGVFSSNRNTRS